jgi:oxidase EvaA
MNRAHGGKLPNYYDIVIKQKGAKLIYCAAHNEEGARFWKKSNLNVIVQLKDPYDKRIKGENFKWASLTQIKKISLKKNVVNPFVKTILFML